MSILEATAKPHMEKLLRATPKGDSPQLPRYSFICLSSKASMVMAAMLASIGPASFLTSSILALLLLCRAEIPPTTAGKERSVCLEQ